LIYSEQSRSEILGVVEKILPSYCFDQYMFYPAVDETCWQKYLLKRLSDSFQDEESSFFFEVVGGLPFLLGCRIPRWDREHFGFGMAAISWLLCHGREMSDTVMEELLDDCISFLRGKDVKFVSAHISGDDIRGLHLLESKGFRYYQTTVYPVASCADLAHETGPDVRLWQESDLPAIIQIAKNHQFSRGHFYCDDKFDKKTVDSMYEKWIRTSWKNKEPVAVIESDGDVVGYFAFLMDDELSKALGYRYGRMRSLSMDSAARGKGLGADLFRAVMSLIGGMGGQYIISEYPLKNFVSARLHTKNLFYPVHEKVLLHLWL
jgi:L-amino acid N-acyltransferase YncA